MIGNAFNEYLTWVDDASALAFVVSLAPGVLIGSALQVCRNFCGPGSLPEGRGGGTDDEVI